MPHTLFLSHRNVLALLSKLDGRRQGQSTHAAIIKNDTEHPRFPQTMAECIVAAAETDRSDAFTGRPIKIKLAILRDELNQLSDMVRASPDPDISRPLAIDCDGLKVNVFVVADHLYYIDRPAGAMHPLNDPGVRKRH